MNQLVVARFNEEIPWILRQLADRGINGPWVLERFWGVLFS